MNDPRACARSPLEAADKVQHQVLASVAAKQSHRPRVRLKGGTLLRACWKHDYRFSEDLDFDWIYGNGVDKETIRYFFDEALRPSAHRYGIRFSVRWGSQKLNLRWEQPRGGCGIIRVDTKPRDFHGVEPSTREWNLLGRYPDVRPTAPILGYTLESVAAAKLECLAALTRVVPRDFYDLDRLLSSGEVDFAAALTEWHTRRESAATEDATSPDDPLSALLEPSLEHLPTLERRWTEATAHGYIPSAADAFQVIAERVFDGLSQAIDTLDRQRSDPARLASASVVPQRAADNRSKTPKCGKKVKRTGRPCLLARGHRGRCRSVLLRTRR